MSVIRDDGKHKEEPESDNYYTEIENWNNYMVLAV